MATIQKSAKKYEDKKPVLHNKIPPQAVDMEESVLGAILIESDSLIKIVDILVQDDFYHEKNGIIYQMMIELFNRKEPIDLLTVTHKLELIGELDKVGGEEYLAHLVDLVPSSAHIEHYAYTVKHKSTLRRLIAVGSSIVELGFDETQEIDHVLDQAEQAVFSVAQKIVKQEYVKMSDALHDAFDRIDDVHNNGIGMKGVKTGFEALDNALGGLQPSNLVILAARPSVGKTSLALEIIKNVAITSGKGAVFFSLEMSKEEVVDRLISSEARVDLFKMKTGKLHPQDFEQLAPALDSLSKSQLFIEDSPGSSVMKMRAILRRILAEVDELGLVVVDYLQLMESSIKNDNMVQQVSEISRSLKSLAREFNVPVVALSQLSRSVESRTPQIPRLSDLRESGSIEQDADVVLFIYREERENPDTERKGIAEIHIAKQRNGPIGKVTLGFKKEYATFINLDYRHQQNNNE
jgi:replicative DNA helicase